MAIHVRSIGAVQILEPEGEFTFGRSHLGRALDLRGRPMDDLREVLDAQFAGGCRRILLDLHRVDFIDSAGLSALVAAKKRAVERGGDIKILRPSERVRSLLVLTYLTRVFDLHDDEAGAVASF
ncbi:MAG: STAS domain-containing protein [Acidobacteria bacterium]|nr:STAS domain-containing protein [Acidobacteriota bacterium]